MATTTKSASSPKKSKTTAPKAEPVVAPVVAPVIAPVVAPIIPDLFPVEPVYKSTPVKKIRKRKQPTA